MFFKVELILNDASSDRLCKKALGVINFRRHDKTPSSISSTLFKKTLNFLDVKQISDFLVRNFSFNLGSKSLLVYFSDICTENTRIHDIIQEILIIYKSNECVIGQIWVFTSQEREDYIFLKACKGFFGTPPCIHNY